MPVSNAQEQTKSRLKTIERFIARLLAEPYAANASMVQQLRDERERLLAELGLRA